MNVFAECQTSEEKIDVYNAWRFQRGKVVPEFPESPCTSDSQVCVAPSKAE